MSLERVPMTPSGLEALEKELRHLKTVERPANTADIETARGHGDLSENAEYHAAKERQAFIHARIAELENVVSRAEVIDPAKQSGERVTFGATVTLVDVDTEKEVTYQIVGAYESDANNGRISVNSPVARALIGREAGDAVAIRTPGGLREYEIAEIRFS